MLSNAGFGSVISRGNWWAGRKTAVWDPDPDQEADVTCAKDFRGVFVFTERDAMESFIESGWEANAQADATAKSGEKGCAWAGAIEIAPGIKLYQITQTGLALQATIQGTKYWKDKDLS